MSPELTLAASLIGRPWRAGACGPAAFNCWGLVRYWMRQAHGIDMSDIATAVDTHRTAAHAAGQLAADADADQLRPILSAARSGGWRPAADQAPAAGDIALLRHGLSGLRHVGVLLEANGGLCMLHCEGTPTDPTPGVVCEPMADVLRRYHGLELWRRAP